VNENKIRAPYALGRSETNPPPSMSRRTKVGSIARQSSNQTFGERARIPSFLQNDAARGRHAGNLSPGAECKVSASSDLLFHANSDSIRGFPRRLGSSLLEMQCFISII